MRRAVLLLLCCTLLACREDPPPPAPAQPAQKAVDTRPATPDYDVDNSLNLMYGAAVVSRGGELHLESSVVHTIDAFSETMWTSAPGVPEDALVFSMLAPTRLVRVGVSTSLEDENVMESVAFDASMDGKTWTELATLKPERMELRQFVDVKPTVAHYLRVRTIDPAKRYYVRLRGVHAMGEEVAAPRTPPFSGCWTINGERAELVQDGARISGRIESDPPTVLEGGTDNRVGMVMWMRGPTFGYAVLTRTPDGRRLSGLSFFEEVDRNIGEAWYGERCEGRLAAGEPAAGPAALLQRAKRLSLYGLAFDPNERLIEEVSAPTLEEVARILQSAPQQRFRIVARELRYDTPQQNGQRAEARLQAVRAALVKRGVDVARIEFVNAGSDSGGIVLRGSLQRFLLSRVDLVSGT